MYPWLCNIYKLRVILEIISNAGLKVDAKKSSFGLKHSDFLGHKNTRDLIKPNTGKVQGVMDIGGSITTNQTQVLAGMV